MLFESLTNREHEILQLLAAGKTNQEIAELLILSTGTVKAHTNHIFGKLAVSNRIQALHRAQELKLLSNVTDAGGIHAGHPHNLPANLTAFIGRKQELKTLSGLLLDSRIRLITILGPGGMGKTHFALETARQHLEFFPDGTFMVSLAQVSEARNIASAIIDALGFSFQPGSDLSALLRDRLQNKKMLLVLDNFEHLSGGIDLLIQLLASTHELKILVTSRERLNISAEVLFVLSGMEYETNLSATNLEQSDAAQLLLHWARASNPTLEFGEADWPHIARICQLTQGMPLAIVLAAGWVEMLSLAEIATELASSINILESQLRDLPERQRSMRATITSSWKRLSHEEQQIFASLSVFRGGFTREAAEVITAATLRQLQTLLNRSFITVRGGRYEIHELLRQFAAEQLENAGLSSDVRTTHSAYYLEFLRQRDDDLKGRRQRDALDEIHEDYENVEAAWIWAVERRDYDALGVAADCLSNFSVMRAFLVRVESLLRHTVDVLAPANDEMPHPVWDKLSVRYNLTRDRLSLPLDITLLDAVIERARQRGDERELAYSLWVLANPALRMKGYAARRTMMDESLALWRQLGDEFYIAHALVGIVGEDMSPEAREYGLRCLRESIEIRRRIGDRYELSFSLVLTGIWLLYICRFEEAEWYLDECLTLQDESYRTPDFAGIMCMKGSIVFWRGDVELSAFYAMIGLNFSGDMNYFGDKSGCQALLAFAECMHGNYSRARALCEEAARDELYDTMAVGVNWGLALACCGLADDDEARRALRTCLEITRHRLKAPLFQYLSLPIAAVLAARRGQAEPAVELLGLAFAQSPNISGWLIKWPLLDDLRRDLQADLGADHFESAWTHGSTLELDTVVSQLFDGTR